MKCEVCDKYDAVRNVCMKNGCSESIQVKSFSSLKGKQVHLSKQWQLFTILNQN